jgi:DNA end-binding protein Ku
MRAIWFGSISFGLVNIPVKLFSGSESNTLDLDMLRKSDLCPIKYLRVCKKDNKEVPYDEIVKGYEYTDGEYIVLTDKDFESARLEKTYSKKRHTARNQGPVRKSLSLRTWST